MGLKKGDRVVIIVILIFLFSFAIINFLKSEEETNTLAVIEMNGQEYKTIELYAEMEKKDIIVEINKDKYFTIIAEEGKIKMAESTCPNKICVNTGWISQIGESIICLPYKTAIYIEEIRGDNN